MFRFTSLLFLLLVLFSCGEKQVPADMVILGGKIYTVTQSQPVVEAVAVRGDKIIFAGGEQAAREFISVRHW